MPMGEKTTGRRNMRSQTIDAIKGAAILLVMAGHVLVWNHMEDGYVYDVIKVIQMPLFIMVSGYLCGLGRRVESLTDYGKILAKRALAYLTPFFFWIVLLHPRAPFSSVVETLFDLDNGLWFLMTLFLLTVMVYTAQLAQSAVRKRTNDRAGKAAFWIVYLGLAAFVVLETLLGWEFLSPGLTRLYLPFYLTGYLAGEYREWLRKILPEFILRYIAYLKKDARGVIGGYFLAQFRIMFVVAVILAVGFLFLDVSYGLVLAVLISILDFLPVFGTGTALFPWAAVKLFTGDYGYAAGLLILYVVTQVARQLIQPKIVGDSMGLPPLMTLFLLYLGFKMKGLAGMILAVPIGLIFINFYKYGAFDSLIENVKILIRDINEFRRGGRDGQQ